MQRESYAASSSDNITRQTNVMTDTGPLIRNRADLTKSQHDVLSKPEKCNAT